jgi:SPP1 family predicted phage head-tail adaptor
MNIASLRVPILFQKNEIVTDKYKNQSASWTDYFACYATIGSSTGSETDTEVIRPEESLDFTCRWCTELSKVDSTHYRILAEGRTYNITYVNPMGYKRNSIKFNCSLEKSYE